MNLKNLLIAIAVSAGISSQVTAFEPILKLTGHWRCWPDCVGKYCCDDYCSKPLPCPVGVKCFECPDYCPKPLPCLAPGKGSFCCDDFCRKRLPPICGTSSKNLRCIPNRLPPTTWTAPKRGTVPSAGLLPSEEAGLQTLPISSSRREQPTLGAFSSDALESR